MVGDTDGHHQKLLYRLCFEGVGRGSQTGDEQADE